jgi:hypothetical protein
VNCLYPNPKEQMNWSRKNMLILHGRNEHKKSPSF